MGTLLLLHPMSLLFVFIFIHFKIFSHIFFPDQWQPTPILLPGKSHGQRSLGAAVHGVAESGTTELLHFHFSFSHIGEGNGNPLQCSWPAESQGRGAWWATVYGVAQSQTRLKRFSSSNGSSPLEMCCLISTYFWSSQICFCYWFLILLLCGQTANLFLSLKECWGLLHGLACSPIWQKFYLHLGRV